MIKRLCTILLAAAAMTPALWAQDCQAPEAPQCHKGKDCASFAPKKGQWEFALMLGKSNSFYNENTSRYLLTNIAPGNGQMIGLPNGSTNQSGNLEGYLNVGGFNNNSLVNIIGLQTKYFFQDCWDVNFSFGMNIGITPKKDYINSMSSSDASEGKYDDPTAIPAQKYVNAQVTNNWFLNVGVDRYFATKNPRINPYVGAVVGFQMAHIATTEPYTGRTVNVGDLINVEGTTNDITEVPESVFMAGGKAGQMMGITGAAVAGVEYGLSQGLYLALECRPLAYRYDIIQIAPQGFGSYNLSHHNIKIVDMPMLKLGVRF